MNAVAIQYIWQAIQESERSDEIQCAERVQVAAPTTPRYAIKSAFWAGVVQTLAADLIIGLHTNQPYADSQRRSKTI
jgi:hypothetical protein